ncbi:uncharacterized protein FYW47_002401 [Aplochiton taeniatus]
MVAGFLLLLLSAATILDYAEAQEAYNRLPDYFKKGVDLALQQINSHEGVHHHFLYFKRIFQSDIDPGFHVRYVYHNFYLKATNCPKGTVDSTACQFRNDRPLIDCAVCYKTLAGEVEPNPKPYINCVHKPSLTKEMKTARVDHCNIMGYSSGSPTLLATKGLNVD